MKYQALKNNSNKSHNNSYFTGATLQHSLLHNSLPAAVSVESESESPGVWVFGPESKLELER